MNIKKKKEMVINGEISVYDLKSKEVESITKSVQKDLDDKKQELAELNQKIRDVKVRIDNFAQ